jgi:2'-5' RNA ligase
MLVETIRTFVAIKIHPEKKLLQAREKLQRQFINDLMNWVNPGNFHVTLCFLGETHTDMLPRLCRELDIIATHNGTFKMDCKDLGIFRSKDAPRVLHLNISIENQLLTLADAIRKKVKNLGFQLDNKKFTPHLTLARIKKLNNINTFYRDVERFSRSFPHTEKVKEFTLYSSRITPQGPVYSILKKFRLNENS